MTSIEVLYMRIRRKTEIIAIMGMLVMLVGFLDNAHIMCYRQIKWIDRRN